MSVFWELLCPSTDFNAVFLLCNVWFIFAIYQMHTFVYRPMKICVYTYKFANKLAIGSVLEPLDDWFTRCMWFKWTVFLQSHRCRVDQLVGENLWTNCIHSPVLEANLGHLGAFGLCSTQEEDNIFGFCPNTTWMLSSGPSWAVSGWRKHTNTHTFQRYRCPTIMLGMDIRPKLSSAKSKTKLKKLACGAKRNSSRNVSLNTK